MHYQCPECDRSAKTPEKLRELGCNCKIQPWPMTDPKDHSKPKREKQTPTNQKPEIRKTKGRIGPYYVESITVDDTPLFLCNVNGELKLAEKIDWSLKDVDLFEINEAFAVVTMSAMHDLDLPKDKVNVHGGACALGHPIGASGARILTTLLHSMEKYDVKKGIATLCIGGGEAVAVAIER